MTRYILTDNVVNEINLVDMLSATTNDDGTMIDIEYLGKCGDELVADCIEHIFHRDYLEWVSSDEAASVATYKLTGDIYELVEGGIAIFDTLADRDIWLNQK